MSRAAAVSRSVGQGAGDEPGALERAESMATLEWGDAGLRAAGTPALLGTGAGSAAIIGRRREHRPAVS